MQKNVSIQKLFILFLSILFTTTIYANPEYNGQINGVVKTIDGSAAAWITVSIKNSEIATITDQNGEFTFRNLKPGDYTLVLTVAGSKVTEKTIRVSNTEAVNTNFTLEQNAQTLTNIIIDGRRNQNHQPVSVGKLPVAPMDLPQSFSVVSAVTLRNQQVQKLSDAIRNVNGIYLSAMRGNAQESFFGRGYRLGSDNFFKNGARINSGVFPEMSSLEKVEVLKGGAAILYGEVAPGGIINMVTKQPKFNFGGEVSLRAGSHNLWKPSFDVYGPINKKVAYRINGTFEDADSYRDIVHSQRYYINPSLLYKASEKTTLLFQADYLNDHYTPDFGIGSLDNTIIADVPRSTFNGTPWQYNKVQQTTASATLDHKFSNKWNLNTSVNLQNYHRDYYSTERIQAKANGDWTRPLNKSLSNENSIYGQVNVTGKINTGQIGHTILAGADIDHNIAESSKFDNPKTYDEFNILDHTKFQPRTDIPVTHVTSMTSTPVTRTGVYVQDLISISNKIKVLAGVRWSLQNAAKARTIDYGKDTLSYGDAQTSNAFSPRFGVVYKLLANTALFASYSNSFSENRGTDVFGNALKPSVIDQYELGVKNDFFNGALSVNVTAYQIVNNNLAQTAQFEKDGVTPNSNTSFKELVGQSTSKGIELDINGHPMKGLDIIAGYSYNDMRYTKTPDTKGSYVEGERLVGTPAHTANGSVFYNFSGKLKGFKLGAGLYYTGDRFAGWNNTKEQSQDYSRLIAVNGFTTVDISAGYTYKKISLIAKVSNLTNTYNYYVHENYSINPIAPRQFMTTVSYRF